MRKPTVSPTPTVQLYKNRDGLAFGPFVSDHPKSLAYALMRLMKDQGDWYSDFFCTHNPEDLSQRKTPLHFGLWTKERVYFLTHDHAVGCLLRSPPMAFA